MTPRWKLGQPLDLDCGDELIVENAQLEERSVVVLLGEIAHYLRWLDNTLVTQHDTSRAEQCLRDVRNVQVGDGTFDKPIRHNQVLGPRVFELLAEQGHGLHV